MPKAEKRPGYHHWTDTKRGQRFWCKCEIGKDHKKAPEFT